MKDKKLKRAKTLFNLLCDAVPACFAVVGIVMYITVVNMTSWFHYEGLAFFVLVSEVTIGIILLSWVDSIVSPKIDRLRNYIQYKERQ